MFERVLKKGIRVGDRDTTRAASLCTVGAGLVYAWMWATFWSTLVLGEAVLFTVSFATVFLVWRTVKFGTFFYFAFSRRYRHKAENQGLVFGIIGFAGTLAVTLAPSVFPNSQMAQILVFAGAALMAVALASLLMLWNITYASLEYEHILRNSASFLGLGAALFLALVFVGNPIATVLIHSFPLISGALLSKAASETRMASYGEDGVDDYDGSAPLSLPASLIVSVLFVAIANGYIRGAGSSVISDASSYSALFLFASIAAVSYVIYLANSLKVVYIGSFLITSAGLMMQALHVDLGTTFIGIGYICFETAMWVLAAALVKKHRIKSAEAYGKIWLLLEIGMMAGTLIGAAGSMLLDDGSVAFFRASFSSCLAYGILVLLSVATAKPFLSIIEDEIVSQRVENEYQKKIESVAREYALTPRETEVLELIAYGRDVRAIENALFVSANTVKTHFKHIYSKCEVTSKQELLDIIQAQKIQ